MYIKTCSRTDWLISWHALVDHLAQAGPFRLYHQRDLAFIVGLGILAVATGWTLRLLRCARTTITTSFPRGATSSSPRAGTTTIDGDLYVMAPRDHI